MNSRAGPRFAAGASEPFREVARREWIWVAGVATLIVAASTVPYLAGYLGQTPQVRFGGAVLDKMDYQSHLAKMWQGYRRSWRYRLLFTPENHEGVYLQTFYVALGHLARLTGLGLPSVYQLARVGLGFLMLLTIYRFISHFVQPVRIRRVAFLLSTVASGFGWMKEIVARTPSGGVSPMSFWLLDGYTYLSLLTFPHFCLAITLILVTFLLLLRREGPLLKEGALAALLSIGLGLIHPYMLLLADLLPLLYWAVGGPGVRRIWRGLLAVAAMGVLQLPLLAYDLWVFRTQPTFAKWSAQNVTLSPSPSIYLWGYGPLLVLGSVGALNWDRRAGKDRAFPLLWIGLVAVLIYMPWNLQRRFLEGVQVPLGLMAGMGLMHVGGKLKGARIRELVLMAVVALMSVGNLYMTAGLSLAAVSRYPSLFWPADVVAAVDWLGEHTSWEQTVLSAPETGGFIPARIGHRVVLGHQMETVDYQGKRAAVARFYAAETSETESCALLEEWGVEYVFYGPYERLLDGFQPRCSDGLEPVFNCGDVSVFRVARCDRQARRIGDSCATCR